MSRSSAIGSIWLFLLLTGLVTATFDDEFPDGPFAGLRLEALQKRRGRELFGKRSGGGMERQSRRTRELFGKRAADTIGAEMMAEAPAGEAEDWSPVADLVELIRAQKRANAGDEQQQQFSDQQQQDFDRILLSWLGHPRARRARGVQRELFGRR